MSDSYILDDPIQKQHASLPLLPKSDSTHNAVEIDLLANEGEYYLSSLFNIEASPGYKEIAALKGHKDFTEERITKLQSEYSKIHAFLLNLNTFERETSEFLNAAFHESASQKIARDRDVIEKLQGNADIEDLKAEILQVHLNLYKIHNDVGIGFEKEQRLQSDLENMRINKQDLIHDIENIRRHKLDMLESNLISEIKELKTLVVQSNNELETLKKDYDDELVSLNTYLSEKDRVESAKERVALAFSRDAEVPIKLRKQIAELKDLVALITAENQNQTQLSLSLDSELEKLVKAKKTLEEESVSQSAAYEEKRGEICQLELLLDDMFKEQEYAKERLIFQKTERVRRELAQKKTLQDLGREHEMYLRQTREKDGYLKLYRRLELLINNVKSSIPSTLKLKEDLKRQLKEKESDESYYIQEANRVRQLIEIDTLGFLNQEKTENSVAIAWEEQGRVNANLQSEFKKASMDLTDLSKQISDLNVKKSAKNMDIIRATSKIRSLKNEHSIKDLAITDTSKTKTEVCARVKDFTTLFELVKNEGSKIKHQIHTASQKALELKQNMNALSTEFSNLRNDFADKTVELSQKKKESLIAQSIRDSHRNEYSRLVIEHESKKDQIESHLKRIEHLNAIINTDETDLVNLKSRYEKDAGEKNQVGIKVLALEEDFTVFQEQLAVIEEISKTGNTALAQRKEEQRKLDLIKWELVRKLNLQKRLEPVIEDTKEKIAQLELERDKLYEKLHILSTEMENSKDPNRCRNLAGADPTIEELTKRIEKLEVTLCNQEEQILEKDLILDEVSALTARLWNQVNEKKEESESIHNSINNLTKRMKSLTRKTMAKVSELSMHQASAMELQRQKTKKEYLLKESLQQIRTGSIPTDELEIACIRERNKKKSQVLALQRLKQKRLQEKEGEMDDNFYMHGETKTTAKPRPNAYLPESTVSGQLPIPKPYGDNSPFKAQNLTSMLRYFKKPEVKPVEI